MASTLLFGLLSSAGWVRSWVGWLCGLHLAVCIIHKVFETVNSRCNRFQMTKKRKKVTRSSCPNLTEKSSLTIYAEIFNDRTTHPFQLSVRVFDLSFRTYFHNKIGVVRIGVPSTHSSNSNSFEFDLRTVSSGEQELG